MDLKNVNKVYFLGIGGIGMSALARYFLSRDVAVFGYDKTPSALTSMLEREGAIIHFKDDPENIPDNIDIVVYTPAIPTNLTEFQVLAKSGKPFIKRAELLGILSKNIPTIAIAGTHGKTTVSCILAHIFKIAGLNFYAFLGGVCANYNTNFVYNGRPELFVVEADEFDRSFLQLNPEIAVITAMDADHLDIYNNKDDMIDTFMAFINKIKPSGKLILKNGLEKPANFSGKMFSYHHEKTSDFYAENIRIENGFYYSDFKGLIKWDNAKTALPGRHNLENAVAAAAVAHISGVEHQQIFEALASFKGVKRRFEICFKNNKITYIDDYAHHPEEIKACLNAARELYPDKKILGVFQPHLFSRTRDFAAEFSKSLSVLDEVLIMDIYAAREKPIAGVNSEMILNNINNKNKDIVAKEDLINTLKNKEFDVLITMGAGDIDRFVEPIKQMLEEKFNS